MPVLLELFAGTGSVGKIAKKMGYSVISVDNEDKNRKPTILQNIGTWKFKTDKRLPQKVDFLWASPPCTSFSILNNSMKTPHRDIKTMKPLTETGRLGNKLLAKTIAIYKYLKKKNPNLKFGMENPTGYMRRMPATKRFNLNSTSYSQYGFNYNKPTDIWTNYPLKLKPRDTSKNPSKMKLAGKMCAKGAQGQSQSTLYRIPGPLIRSILKQAKGKMKKEEPEEK